MKAQLLFIVILILSSKIYGQTEEVLVPKSTIESSTKSDIFVIVEQMPEFQYKNCKSTNQSFARYMVDSIKFPSIDCFGKVYIQFVVEVDSTIGEINILRGLDNCEGYKKEVKRLVSSMPNWTPGRQRGNLVRVMMTMPIIFDPSMN